MTKREMKETETQSSENGQILLYQDRDGKTEVEVSLRDETVWLSQKQMASLFDKDTDTIGLHLRNIFSEGELDEAATTEDSSVVQQEGARRVRRKIRFYNLDTIISVGYRVNSKRGTQFRIWATNVLRGHLVEGYTLNRKRLQALYRHDQSKRIADNALVALTLMVAESKPQEKDLIVNMTVNLINKRNV